MIVERIAKTLLPIGGWHGLHTRWDPLDLCRAVAFQCESPIRELLIATYACDARTPARLAYIGERGYWAEAGYRPRVLVDLSLGARHPTIAAMLGSRVELRYGYCHAKVLVADIGHRWLVVSGSANLGAGDRLEYTHATLGDSEPEIRAAVVAAWEAGELAAADVQRRRWRSRCG